MERARKAEDKRQRREDFLAAAESLFAETSFADVKMAEVARRAGMSKGSLFTYFPTKEHLFLDLLESRLWAWLASLRTALDTGGRWSPGRVARSIADSLVEHRTLIRLLAILGTVLEHNVSLERVTEFKIRLIVQLGETGSLLEKRVELPAGEGTRVLQHLYALTVGLWQLSDPSPIAAQALENPDLAPLHIDFHTELTRSLTALLRGYGEVS